MASFLDQVFGSKPKVAPYTPTLLPEEQIKSILANISAFPEIDQLGNLYEQYMTNAFDQAGFPLQDILQGGEQMVKTMEGQAQQFLEGKIPQDVQDQLRRQDALTSLLSGGPGGASALTSRDLGLTSLNLINQGAALAGQAGNAAQRWAGLASGLIMSPSGMMITPQQQAAMTMQNNLYQQATKQFGYNVAAAPNAGLQALNQWIEQVGGTVVGSYLGGGGMGGGKGANYMTSATNWGSPNLAQGAGGAQPTQGGYNFGGVPTAADEYGSVFNTGGQVAPVTSNAMDYGVGYPAANPYSYFGNSPDMSSLLGLTPTGTSDFLYAGG